MPKARSRTVATAMLLAAGLSGCVVVGPDFEPPAPELPAAYDAPVPPLFRDVSAAGPWWSQFGDPLLSGLIRQGLEANLDLRVAAARVREARAAARGVAALTGPRLDSSAEAEAERTIGGDRDDDRANASLGAFLDGLWEIDLFGGLARSREAAWAEAARQAALEREARRLVQAEIARTYFSLRAAEHRLALTRASLDLQSQTLALVGELVEAGLARGVDQVRADAAVAALSADLAPLQAEIDRLRNALAVLLAEPPGALDARLAAGRARTPRFQGGSPIGPPAELVRRRADVQAAELAMAVASARIGVAVADLYPRLVLPGTIGVSVGDLGGNAAGAALASLSAVLDLPLLDGGARTAAVDAAEARATQAALAYRSVLLQALQEVEAALLGYAASAERRAALEQAAASNRAAYEQARLLYRQGFASFIDVLDSQRQLNESLQEFALADRDLSLEVVNLYAALGGAE